MTDPLEAERQAIALELWASAKRLEELGNNATKGIDLNEQPDEWARAQSRTSAWFGGASALENAAWKVLARSGQAVDSQFFEKHG